MHQFLGASAKLRKAIISFVMSACLPLLMEQLGFHWMDWHEIDFWAFCENLSRKFKLH